MAGYVFILGRNPNLSLAELDVVLRPVLADQTEPLIATNGALVAPGLKELDPVATIKKIGGTTKIGRLLATFDTLSAMQSAFRSSKWISEIFPPAKHRVEFGVSITGFSTAEKLASEVSYNLKRGFEELDHSARIVEGTGGELSSVVVAKNGLIAKGFELLIVSANRRIYLARTVAIQPFRNFGERDFGRPERDARSGMLPPKLALMMVNLSAAPISGRIVDPFCGSGTVLQEAWLRGYRSVEGSDTSEKAVSDSAKNMLWLKATIPILKRDAREIAKAEPPQSIDAIITEPDLGPPTEIQDEAELTRRVNELSTLYRVFLRSAAVVLKPKGVIVMVWPVFHAGGKAQAFFTRDVVPPELHVVWPYSEWVPRTARQTLPYERPGQTVTREIVLLKKRERPTPQSEIGRREHTVKPSRRTSRGVSGAGWGGRRPSRGR
jgi:tRNA G10  N-methylase Trm11